MSTQPKLQEGTPEGRPIKVFGTTSGETAPSEKCDASHEICVDSMRTLKAFHYKNPLKGTDLLSRYMLDKNWKNVPDCVPETFEAVME